MDKAQCQAEINASQSQLAEKEQERAMLQERIDRLERAYESIKPVKEEIEGLKREIEKRADQEDTWKGVEFSWYSDFMREYFVSAYSDYYKRLDEIHDTILDELTTQKNLKEETEGFMGWLRSRCNDLYNLFGSLTN